MIILGIDPGYAIVGYGVIRYENGKFTTLDYGAILTKPETPFPVRLEQIFDGISQLIDLYKPDVASIEELFFNTNVKTAIAVGQARGTIVLACQKKKVRIYEYTPLQVKQAVVGYGRAEKKQVQEMTKMLLNLKKPPKLDDTADALALAICHAHSNSSQMFRG